LFAACATSMPVEPLPKAVSFSDSSEPLVPTRLGKVQVEPFSMILEKDLWLKIEDGFYSEYADINLKTGLHNLLGSSGLFGTSTVDAVNVRAKPISFEDKNESAFSSFFEVTVKYEFRTDEGTLIMTEKVTSRQSRSTSGSRRGGKSGIEEAVSANLAKLSHVVKEKLPNAWKAYTEKRNAERKRIEVNLKREDRYFRVISAKATVRNMPEAGAKEVASLPQADRIQITGSLPSGWLQVSREGKPIGWVHSSLLGEDFASSPTYKPVGAPKTSLTATPPPAVPADVVASSFDFGSYHALVAGNNEYHHLPNLHTAINDAQAIASLLQNSYGFSVSILRNGTRADILRTINGYRRTLTNRDNLLIYYAGHGWLDKEADQGYWLPVDAEEYDPTNWISNSSITDALRAIQAKHVLVIADSCYSGKLARGINIRIRTKNYYEKILRKKARTVMASGGLEPVADEGGADTHSVFASALIEALNENQGVLDGTLLFSQIRRPVMVNTDQTPEYSDIRKAGHDGGDFIFVKQKK